jgi:hypothetical protein
MLSLASLSAGKPLPARVNQVLQQLETIYGGNIVIKSATASEIQIQSRTMTDAMLIANMMTQSAEIFGHTGPVTGPACVLGPMDFQILAAQSPAPGQGGLWLRYLPNLANRQDYFSGFWFY